MELFLGTKRRGKKHGCRPEKKKAGEDLGNIQKRRAFPTQIQD